MKDRFEESFLKFLKLFTKKKRIICTKFEINLHREQSMNFESFSRETWNEGREREREERESESWHFLQASWREKEGRKKRENNRYTDEIPSRIAFSSLDRGCRNAGDWP